MATYKETSHTFGTFTSELKSVNTTFIAKLNFEDLNIFWFKLPKEMIESTTQE